MTDRLIIALAQMNQRVGDLEGNAAAILAMREQAARADLLMVPELQLTGYPPEDLVLKPEFVRRTMEAAERLVDATAAPGPALLFGSIHNEGGLNYNVMILAEGGRILARTLKRELPNYGTFDEKRVFASGPLPEPIEYRGVKIGVPICEDIWQEAVCSHLADAGAEILLVPNGSPYELDKDDKRALLVRSRVVDVLGRQDPDLVGDVHGAQQRARVRRRCGMPNVGDASRVGDDRRQVFVRERREFARGHEEQRLAVTLHAVPYRALPVTWLEPGATPAEREVRAGKAPDDRLIDDRIPGEPGAVAFHTPAHGRDVFAVHDAGCVFRHCDRVFRDREPRAESTF